MQKYKVTFVLEATDDFEESTPQVVKEAVEEAIILEIDGVVSVDNITVEIIK